MRLEGKVAIITGGANGMGAEECRIFAREGAKVVIADILEEEGKQVEAEIAEAGGDAVFVRLDVTSEDNWQSAVEADCGAVRQAGCAGEQRGHRDGEYAGQPSRRRLGQTYEHQREGRVPWDEARDTGDAEGGRRLHREHIVNIGNGRPESQCTWDTTRRRARCA